MQRQTRAEIDTSVKEPEPRCIRISKQIRGRVIDEFLNNSEILFALYCFMCYTLDMSKAHCKDCGKELK